MKIIVTIFSLLCPFLLWAQNANTNYKLVWSDEFNSGTTPNVKYWKIEVNGVPVNNELEYYTNRPENVRVENGNLIIEAHKENYLGRLYTSARINTEHKKYFKHGRVEARMKLPYGKGMWPAFWMLGESFSKVSWPYCGEMDIMEMVGGGDLDNQMGSAMHWYSKAKGGHTLESKDYLLNEKLTYNYHIFALEWDEKEIRTYIDSIHFFSMDITTADKAVFHNDFFILLNLAVGGDWPGSPDASTIFPQQLLVDYVRVYQKDTGTTSIESSKKESSGLKVFPNPVKDTVSFEFGNDSSGSICQLFSSNGWEVLKKELGSARNNTLSVRGLEAGIYILKITSGNNTYTQNISVVN